MPESPILPPELDEEMVHNGRIPRAHLAARIEGMIKHLLGLHRVVPCIDIGEADDAHSNTVNWAANDTKLTIQAYPGARDLEVVLWAGGISNVELTLKVDLSTGKSITFPFIGQNDLDIDAAQAQRGVIRDALGTNSGKTTAGQSITVTISKVGGTASFEPRLWIVGMRWLHNTELL